ncbi:MAG: glycosyltransferase family 2 protein [Chloroflexi bacterium]|nr:glycosyltransferase family 2 protein [Chloroflexota bacterium]
MSKKNKQPPTLSIILPAYNEGAHIFANLMAVCGSIKKANFEIIVVDDGSSDNTFSETRRAAKARYPVKVIRNEANLGKGASLFRGFEEAKGELIAFLDADLEIAPHHIVKLQAVMKKTGADAVIGIKDTLANRFPLPRQITSAVYRHSIGFLFGLNFTDTQTGIKLFKREVLEAAAPRLSISRFAFDIELLVAASRFGYQIVEHPVEVTYQRKGGMGRMKLSHLAGTFFDTLAVYFRASFWRWLEPSYGTQFWMIVFVFGVFLAGVGFSKLLTPVILNPPFNEIARIIFLQFLPTTLRDKLLATGGTLMLLLALIQLNKSLLNAFARRDRGDLAGILRK